jgi:hypothetical protein
MNPAWRERLAAMEMHLDIRKSLMRAQAPKPKSPAPTDALKGLLR